MTEEELQREENMVAIRRQQELKAAFAKVGLDFGAMLDVKFEGTAVVKRAGTIIKQSEEQM